MRLWTIHSETVLKGLRSAGVMQVCPSYYHEHYVPWQYEWLAARLTERVAGYRGALPWWLYCEKPDLRWARHHRPGGEHQVLIEVETCPSAVFPCWAWDVVHSGKYLAADPAEQTSWQKRMAAAVDDEDQWPLPDPWRTELEASWKTGLFDPEADAPPSGMVMSAAFTCVARLSWKT